MKKSSKPEKGGKGMGVVVVAAVVVLVGVTAVVVMLVVVLGMVVVLLLVEDRVLCNAANVEVSMLVVSRAIVVAAVVVAAATEGAAVSMRLFSVWDNATVHHAEWQEGLVLCQKFNSTKMR
jgi:hypothetical protein